MPVVNHTQPWECQAMFSHPSYGRGNFVWSLIHTKMATNLKPFESHISLSNLRSEHILKYYVVNLQKVQSNCCRQNKSWSNKLPPTKKVSSFFHNYIQYMIRVYCFHDVWWKSKIIQTFRQRLRICNWNINNNCWTLPWNSLADREKICITLN